MASRRDQISMNPVEVAEFLESGRILNVATLGPTGHPHLVAMWYVMRDGAPAFWTFSKSQKVINIRRDPRITVLVEHGDSYEQLRGVELRGSARILEDPAEVLDIGRGVAVKYTGPQAGGDDALPFLERQAAKRVGIVIDVEHIASWDHTKLGGAY